MMDSSHLNQEDKSSPETYSDSSLSGDSADLNDIFGDPLVHPRVGDEYQAEIPSMLSESEAFQLMLNPADSKGIADSSHSFLLGLPLPVMWIHSQRELFKTERTELINDSHEVYPNGIVKSENLSTDQVYEHIKKPNVKVNTPSNGGYLVPGQPTEYWSDFEADCFLLGLYLLGKKLEHVTRFMESKGQGQVLAYYYGQFYGSAKYIRWSENRKLKSKKCVIGHRFFSGCREQELISRLSPRLSEESRAQLLEASRAFADGRNSLDEYVFTLKALVGIHALVDAVGIGMGKADLTTVFFDGSRNNSHRPEMPSGKDCSTLTRAEIVKYLTGDFRLSKARSNDLFWEAVWPRLLARGWHSEQPMGDGFTGSKHCLVFLTPGIKKFSRRKLSKGDHYFDSVSDVLAKVANEPDLLQLEADETDPRSSKNVNGWAMEAKSDNDQNSSDHERHCYLKPRFSSGLSDQLEFTVVDTSLADEENPFKVREMRRLPIGAKRCSAISLGIKKIEKQSPVDANSLPNDLQDSSFSLHSKGTSTDDGGRPIIPGGNLDLITKQTDANLRIDYKSRTIKHQFSRRVKPGLSGCAIPVTKKRRLTSSAETDFNCVLSLPAKKKIGISKATLKIIGPKVSHIDVKATSDNSLVVCSHGEQILSETSNENSVDCDITAENDRKLIAEKGIDLNLPHVFTESDSDSRLKPEEKESVRQKFDAEEFKLSAAENQKHCDLGKQRDADAITNSSQAELPEHFNSEKMKDSEDSLRASDNEPLVTPPAEEPSNKHVEFGQQPRRQSTRNRPLTTKALEALEFGFLDPVRTYKKRSPAIPDNQRPKRSRQRHKSPMLSHDMSFEVGAAKISCDARADVAEHLSMVSIPNENQVVGLSEVSFRPGTS